VLAFALLTTLTLEMLGGQATLREGATQQRAAMEKA